MGVQHEWHVEDSVWFWGLFLPAGGCSLPPAELLMLSPREVS